MKRLSLVIVVIAMFAALAYGQHGKAEESGLYSFNYRGDTWTGIVTSVDSARCALTLTYEHKKRHEIFTGVLKPPLELFDKDGRPAKVRRINDGDKIEVYYLPMGMKVKEYGKADYTAEDNLIFKIKLLKLTQSP